MYFRGSPGVMPFARARSMARPAGCHLLQSSGNFCRKNIWKRPENGCGSLSHILPRAKQQRTRQLHIIASSSERAAPSVAVAGQLSAFMALGVSNRVFYRMALEPMKQYMFFLAQLQTFSYVLVYFTTLYVRWRKGLVDKEMLAIPKGRFVLIGACEALGSVLMMIGAAELPGAVLPLVSQILLVWTLIFSWLILGIKLKLQQAAGALLVAAGVIVSALPSSGAQASNISGVALAVCAVSYAFPAFSAITKEAIFRDAKESLGRPLDIFVVNSFGSLCQAFFVVLLLPLMLGVRDIPLSSLPQYLSEGWATLLGSPPAAVAAAAAAAGSVESAALGTGAPLLPLAYIAVNLLFNIIALLLVRNQGTLVLSIAAACIIPLNIFVFTLPLPLLVPSVLGPTFLLGTAILLLGLGLYNLDSWGQLLRGWLPSPATAKP